MNTACFKKDLKKIYNKIRKNKSKNTIFISTCSSLLKILFLLLLKKINIRLFFIK